jgi:hypothetical protein
MAFRNSSSGFEQRDVRTTLTRELWTSEDRTAQFQARVGLFGGNLVRIGISRFWWSQDDNKFAPSQKGHCYFPVEVLDGLVEVIPELRAEAKRVQATIGAAGHSHGTCT